MGSKILNEREREIYSIVSKGEIDTKSLAKQLGLSTRRTREIIQEIKGKGYPLNAKRKANLVYHSRPDALEDIVASDFQATQTSFDNPYKLKIEDPTDFSIGFANTIYAGGDTSKELFRNFLRYANHDNLDSLVITGNTIWMDLMRYSKYKPDRAVHTTVPVNPGLVEYPEAVVNSGRDPAKLLEEGELVYLTFKERLDMVIQDALGPLFLEEGKPIYDGSVLLVLGNIEEELARQHTNQTIKLDVDREKSYATTKLQELRAKLRKEKKEERDTTQTESEIDDWTDYGSRLSMTNVDHQRLQSVFGKMKGYVTRRLEAAIPNCQVISSGTGYIEADGLIGKIKATPNQKSPEKASSKLASKLRDDEVAALSQNGASRAPDFVVGGGLSPNLSILSETVVGLNGEKVMETIQLSTCLDAESLERMIEEKVRISGDNALKLAGEDNFEPGAYVLRYVTDSTGLRIPIHKELRNEYLMNSSLFKQEEKASPSFYQAQFSDIHWGANTMAITETSSQVTPTFVMAQRFLRELKAPLVGVHFLGDETQARNHDTAAETHKDQLTGTQLNYLLNEIEKSDLSHEEKLKSTQLLALDTVYRYGIVVPYLQMEDLERVLDTTLFRQVIDKADQVGFYGPSIMLANGNHDNRTSEGNYITAQDIAKHLRKTLGASEREMMLKDKEVQRIMAPMLGTEGLFRGLYGIDPSLAKNTPFNEAAQKAEGYLYGVYGRHKQGGTKRGNRMDRQAEAFNWRGQADGLFDNRMVINTSAHDHMGGRTSAKDTIHLRGYCFMGRNGYGEVRDYGAPTQGFVMLGLPKEGPTTGPVTTISIYKHHLDHWAKEGQPDIQGLSAKLFKDSV